MRKNKFIKIIAATTILTLGLTTISSCTNDNPPIINNENKELTIEGSATLNIADTVTYIAKVDGEVISGVTWKSNNKKVAVIDSATGELTIISVGTTEISVTKDGYKEGKLLVRIVDPTLKEITIVGENTVKTGATISFTAKDSNGGATLDGVTWSTSNTNVATISKNTGILTGRNEGEVIVTANKEGYNPATIKVTVTKGSELEAGSHMIVFTDTVGVSYVCDKTTAKKGETVSFSITTSTGVTVVKVTLNDTTEITKTGDKYSFVMPDEDVRIRATINVESDVSIGGEQAIGLVLGDDGIYKSDELTLTNTAQLTYFVKGENGEVRALDYSDFDHYKCFGDIETAKDYNKYGFKLAGGFKYVFYYNPQAEKPCYIIRTEVVNLPNNASSFESLFDGGKNALTTFPQNVSKVTYTNSKTSEKYEFNRYQNNKSIARVTNLLDQTKEKAVVYKEYDGTHEKVVDTYIESINDPTKKDDSKIYSGIYDVVENEESFTGYKAFEKTKREAIFDANHYSHDMNSIEFDIMYAYRVGFGADDGIYHLENYTLDIKSTPSSDGGFTTTIDTTKKYEDDSENYYRYFVYDVEISFHKDGSIKEGTYIERSYGKEDYDFEKDQFLTGGEARGTLEKELTFKYEYSTTLTTAPAFDLEPYFIKTVDNLRVNNEDVNEDESKNILKKGDVIETSTGTLSFDYTPTTALDSWQYDIIESSNEDVIGHSNSYRQFKALGFGEAELTLGNHTTNHATDKVSVTVPNNAVPVRGLYFDGTFGNVNETIEIVRADKVRIYGGATSKVTLRTSPDGSNNTELKFEVNKPELLSVNYDYSTEILTMDATKASVNEPTEVKITVTSDSWDPDSISKSATLYVVIEPGSDLTFENLVGTWKADPNQTDYDVSKDAITFTNTFDHEEDGIKYYKASATNGTYSREFLYGIDDKNMPVVKTIGTMDTIHITYNTMTKQIGFYLEYTEFNEMLGDYETTYLLGFVGGEEEYDIYYEMFDKVVE